MPGPKAYGVTAPLFDDADGDYPRYYQQAKRRPRKRFVVGVDEVGRGPLAGSVVAAAVILDPSRPIAGLTDSKLLTEPQRIELDQQIRDQAIAFAIAEATVAEIDDINILHASMLAMQRAVGQLEVQPQLALIDGNRCPALAVPSQAVIKGDQTYCEISAASIIAKVARDNMMLKLHQQHPAYGFDRHKGYPTRQHFAALDEHGVLADHRRSFAPVRAALQKSSEAV